MPLGADEILDKLVAAMEEGRATTRELHEARGAANDIIKKQKKEIADLIKTTVEAEVLKISNDVREIMSLKMNDIMDRIEKDWREKLGLDG